MLWPGGLSPTDYPHCDVPCCPIHNDAYEVDVDWLRKNCSMIHYFGLGFIQVKLTEKTRMHFYTDKLPSIMSQEEIHDHRYDFMSWIVRGSLRQDLYAVSMGPQKRMATHEMTFENCSADANAPQGTIDCAVDHTSSSNYRMGSWYALKFFQFHRVHSHHCITFLHRTGYKQNFARVVRTKGTVPVCPFSKKIPTDDLWQIIEGML